MNRILVVEDEPALLRGLKDNFASLGYEVLLAADGQAGLDLALSAGPDLIGSNNRRGPSRYNSPTD